MRQNRIPLGLMFLAGLSFTGVLISPFSFAQATEWTGGAVSAGAPMVKDPSRVVLKNFDVQRNSVKMFETFEITFRIEEKIDNPYDPQEADIQAVFTAPTGESYNVPAFYYEHFKRSKKGRSQVLVPQGTGVWKVRFTPFKKGVWKYEIKGIVREEDIEPTSGTLECDDSKLQGFVRVDSNHPAYFSFDNGENFFIIGENLAWSADPLRTYSYDVWVDRLASSGVNTVRVWLASWFLDPVTTESGLARYDQSRLWELDYVLDLLESKNIHVILCLLDHGQFSRKQDADWHRNPYNKDNGGPLSEPNLFFKDKRSKTYFKNLLRYLGARYAYHTHLLSWEWFNEVDLSELKPEEFPAWLDEMTPALRKNDPYRHMITTGFHKANPENIWSRRDIAFTQFHVYENRDYAGEFSKGEVRRMTEKFRKPFIYGEFGWISETFRNIDRGGIHLHDGLWTSALAGSGGAALVWYWDVYIHEVNLYFHFRGLSSFLDKEDMRQYPDPARVDYDKGKLLVIAAKGNDRSFVWIKNRLCTLDKYIAFLTRQMKQKKENGHAARKEEVTFPESDVKQATIVLKDLREGTYLLEWWDPYKGNVISKERCQAQAEGLSINVPSFSRDIALKIKKDGFWDQAR